ncbi:radical SAM protein [Rhodopseudomonas palustris]|uniref:radical SAM protein n=1 Tax=Rhodopseudomonas palustris TaxID=1076 RepID=UPI0020CD4065|nr:radical SAM protein [Rhodopseudomonas palustris]
MGNEDFIHTPLMSSRLKGAKDELGLAHDRYYDRLVCAGLWSNHETTCQSIAQEFVTCIGDFGASSQALNDFDKLRKVNTIDEIDVDPAFSIGQLLLYFICSAKGMASGFRVLDEIEKDPNLLTRIHEKLERNLAIVYLWRGFLHLIAGRNAKALSCFRRSKHLCNINLVAQIYGEKLDIKLYGKPAKPLEDRFCSYPFAKLYTNQSGETHHCCLAFSPLRAGSIDDHTFDWNSKSSVEFRRSILDGSFTYCDKTSCSFIVGGSLPTREEAIAEDPRLAAIIKNNVVEIEPTGLELVFEHDASCNLACPSCRSDLIAHPKIATEKLDQRFPYLLDLVAKSKRLSVSGYGDPFFSRHYRQLLKLINKANSPELKIDLITNALLFTPQTWESYAHLQTMFGSISVSIDAAKADTYAKVRKLGDFGKLIANLEFISKLRQEGVFSNFLIQCVVQADNFREMEDFVDLGQRLAVDGVIFQRLFPYGVYIDPTKYEKVDVFSPSHPEHQDFIKVLRSDRLKRKGVSFSTFQDLYDRLNPIDYYFDSLRSEGGGLSAAGWAYLKSGHQTGNVSIVLKREGKKKRFSFETHPVDRPDVADSIMEPRVRSCGFSLPSDGKNLPAGRYQVGIRVNAPEGSVTDFTHEFIEVTRQPMKKNKIEYAIDILEVGQDLVVHGWAFLSNERAAGKISLVLRSLSNNRRIVLEVESASRPDVAEAYGCDVAESGFTFSSKGRTLPPDEYEVGICIVRGNKRAICFSERTVTLKTLSAMVA